jgi:hypothetical protein
MLLAIRNASSRHGYGLAKFELNHQTKHERGHRIWALVIFTVATTGASASTVTSVQFSTQHLCLIAERQLESLRSL